MSEKTPLGTVKLFDAQSAFIKDSLDSVRAGLAQVPEGKTGALIVSVDWKGSLTPTLRTGIAHRTVTGWEIHGEGFISRAEKGASVKVVKTW